VGRKVLIDFHPIASLWATGKVGFPNWQIGSSWFKIFQKVAHYPYSTPAATVKYCRNLRGL